MDDGEIVALWNMVQVLMFSVSPCIDKGQAIISLKSMKLVNDSILGPTI